MLLDRFPRVALAHRPTPLEALPRLSDRLGGPRILVKRDDCTGLAGGGNKSRQLEYLLGDALSQGADTLITHGAIQSNHVRQTAAAAAKLGLRCRLILERRTDHGDPAYLQSGNVLMDYLLGAEIAAILPRGADMAAATIALGDECRRAGGKPYIIPGGAASALGALGYVDCAGELAGQADRAGLTIDHVILASGSGGTHAGLVAGFHAIEPRIAVTGFSVGVGTNQHDHVLSLARDTWSLIGGAGTVGSGEVRVSDVAAGAGYGMPGETTIEAIRLVARCEGIMLDPVYTGKAMAGLMAMIGEGLFTPDETVVFIHTGGLPSLFAYKYLFGDEQAGGSALT
ncbi:MAG: D-cysteine desulfhydrase [Rhizorhabdus sp.]|jgi:L-cysteate sulfo-lyase|nr:MAG: D-cysteine desulfhydrase [Rhizorhabdus sp.]